MGANNLDEKVKKNAISKRIWKGLKPDHFFSNSVTHAVQKKVEQKICSLTFSHLDLDLEYFPNASQHSISSVDLGLAALRCASFAFITESTNLSESFFKRNFLGAIFPKRFVFTCTVSFNLEYYLKIWFWFFLSGSIFLRNSGGDILPT